MEKQLVPQFDGDAVSRGAPLSASDQHHDPPRARPGGTGKLERQPDDHGLHAVALDVPDEGLDVELGAAPGEGLTRMAAQAERIGQGDADGLRSDVQSERTHDPMLPCPAMSDQNDKPTPPRQHVQVQVDDSVAQGIYSNFVLVNHTEYEFLLDFAFFAPGTPAAKVRARILSSPRHTKRLLKALQQNLERYEARFGAIEVGRDDDGSFVH